MELSFSGKVWFWRGPAPWYFVVVPDNECAAIEAIATQASYGWGCIPARVRAGDTEWTTSLMPKDGGYLVPVKAAVRKVVGWDADDEVTVRLTIET